MPLDEKETKEIKNYIRRSFRIALYQSAGVAGLPILGIGLTLWLYSPTRSLTDEYAVTFIIGLILCIIGLYKLDQERKNI